MPESTDVFVITRNGGEALLHLGYFHDEEVAGGFCFMLQVEMPEDTFDTLRVPFGGDGECCGECDCCEPAEAAQECLGAADPACVCTGCLERRLDL